MTKIVLDTDVLIDVLRGRKAAQAFLEDVMDRFVPSCSVISVAEIFVGMRQEEERATRTLLDGLVIIPVTQDIAEVAGRFRYKTKNRRLELADCLIAATVFVEGAVLATGNMKDYPMPEITVIQAR